FASTVPHELGHEGPATLQRMPGSGSPRLWMRAWIVCFAPSSTLATFGEREMETSLEMLTLAAPNLEESAWLVAVTCTVPPEGRSVGAAYTPSTEIVPA